MSLALHNAAREGNVVELTKLLAQNASVQNRDKHSRTPLHLAAWAGQLEYCKLLVAEGADKGAAAMDDTTALHFAAQKGHSEVVRFLLNEGVSVNGKTRKGMTALMFAAQSGNVDLIKMLVKRKADVLSKNKAGKSAEDLAKHAEIKQILQEAMQHAQQEKHLAQHKVNNDQKESAAAHNATDAANGAESQTTAVSIGPQERPSASTQQEGRHDSKQQLTDSATRKRTSATSDLIENDPSRQVTAADRPSKAQKVALSFAEDEEL